MSHDIVIIVRSLTANSKLVLLMTNFCYNFVILSSIHFSDSPVFVDKYMYHNYMYIFMV